MDDWRAQTIVSLIERSGPTRLFTVVGVNRKLIPPDAAWPAPGGYVEMRLKRIALAGLPPVEAERVKKLCGDRR